MLPAKGILLSRETPGSIMLIQNGIIEIMRSEQKSGKVSIF
jgi:hypothetical protein